MFKKVSSKIHIGSIINKVIKEKGLEIKWLESKLGLSTKSLKLQLNSESLDSESLLKWSRVLKYDFFKFYSSHLMYYYSISSTKNGVNKDNNLQKSKNTYTKDLILSLLSKVWKKEMTSKEIIDKYSIPKTTFYKWLQKYPYEDK